MEELAVVLVQDAMDEAYHNPETTSAVVNLLMEEPSFQQLVQDYGDRYVRVTRFYPYCPPSLLHFPFIHVALFL